MRNLVVFCDCTWNNPKREGNRIPAPANVVQSHNALADSCTNGSPQLKYYHPGLGGEGLGRMEKVLGGALGIGVTRHIMCRRRPAPKRCES